MQNVNHHQLKRRTTTTKHILRQPPVVKLNVLSLRHQNHRRHQPNPNSLRTTIMTFFHHRKLMPYSESAPNLTLVCSTICDSLNNTAHICPIKDCSAVCPQICTPLLSYLPLPPLESPPPPPPPPSQYASSTHSKLSPTLKISIALLVTTFSVFVLYTLYKFYTVWSRSRRNHHPSQDDERTTRHDDFVDEDHGPVLDHPIWYIRTIGLQPTVISAIPIVKYKKGEGLVEGTDCSICLSEFQEGETLRLLPKCSHAFHIPCIDTWLQSHTNCPLCRAGIIRIGASSLSLSEPVIEDSSILEETRVGISVDTGEMEMEREEGDRRSELRVGSEDEDEMLSKLEMGNGEASLRRSVSLHCLSAARLSAEIANAQKFHPDGDFGTKSKKEEILISEVVVPSRVEGSCSIARSLQRGPEFIKRSFSCSGKVLF